MSIINRISKVFRPTAKQLLVGGIFALAFAGAVGLGLQTRQHSSAAIVRDGATNSIDNADANGGVGAADPTELIKDLKGGKPSDLAGIYSHFGLTPSKYDDFEKNAKNGTLYRDGRVVVNGVTVMEDALTLGRTTLGLPESVRKPVTINGKTYYQSKPEHSFAGNRQTSPVMVYFDNKGVAQTVIMNACGNPVQGKPKTPSATCKAINSVQDKTNPNKFSFTTNATFAGNAKLQKVVYTFSDGTTVTKTSLTDAVSHTFTKDGSVKATVYATTPNGAVITTNCEKQVKYTPPMVVCTGLVATVLDTKKQNFRFTVKVSSDKNSTVKHVDFTADSNTTTGVTTKDASGNIYKEYTFADDKQHTVKATVHFNTLEGVKTATCEAKVTGTKTPMCTVPGFEHLPPDSPQCGYCKEGIPVGDARCKDVPQVLGETTLPETGAGNLVGAFAGTSVLGAAGHFLYNKRRANRASRQG